MNGCGSLAKIEMTGLEKFSDKLKKLGADIGKIAGRVVRAGADPVADAIRTNLEKNLRDPAGVGRSGNPYKQTRSTGDLLNSFGITPPNVDEKGRTNVHIGFEGYDRKHTANALKARAMESGTSVLKKRPFVRPAVAKTRKQAISNMQRTLDEELKIHAL